MRQGLSSTNRKYSEDAAEQAYRAHLERWTQNYGGSISRLLADRERPAGIHALTDFVWDKGVLDLVSPLNFETRDALRAAAGGFPWGSRSDVELYWRLMYAALAEMEVSVATAGTDPKAAYNPFHNVMGVTMMLIGRTDGDEGGSYLGFLTSLVAPGAGETGSVLLKGLLSLAANQVRLRTGRHCMPEPIRLSDRVRVGEIVALAKGYGHDGRILLDRETLPSPAQAKSGLGWNLEPKHGRWQSWAMPWQIEPLP